MKRQIIHQKYDGHCAYCGEVITIKEMQIDHVEPKANGGSDKSDNLTPACRACNFYKGSETIEQFREMLSTIPVRLEKIFIFRLALKYGLISINQKQIEFFYERSNNPLSCVGCKYYNTLDDDLCGTCGDTYQNKTEKIIN